MMQTRLKPLLDAMIKPADPLKRPAVPEEVVESIIFLCSPGASYINGTGLIIDAGATLNEHV